MMSDLFESQGFNAGNVERYHQQVTVLRAYALQQGDELIDLLKTVILPISPFRFMLTPGGRKMSASITNCGDFGWITDHNGYRYTQHDPHTRLPWPELPSSFIKLATDAAKQAGFNDFAPDSCIINKYAINSKMALHQDSDELDLSSPIVSVSLGIPALFQLGGFNRHDPVIKIPLFHGDIVIWGGVDRLRFHGVLPIKQNTHTLTKNVRINLSFRTAR